MRRRVSAGTHSYSVGYKQIQSRLRVIFVEPGGACSAARPGLVLTPAFHGLGHGDLVRPLEVRSHRYPHRDPRHADTEGLQDPGQVDGRRLSLDGRARGEDDLVGNAPPDAIEQPLDL